MSTEERRPILPPLDEDDDHLIGPLHGSKPKYWVVLLVLSLFFISHGIAIPIDYYYAEYYLQKVHGVGISVSSKNNSLAMMTYPYGIPFYPIFENASHLINKDMATFLMYNKIADCSGILPAIFFGPLIDRIGRRFGLIVPSVGMLLKAIFFYLLIMLDLNMYFILVGVLVESLSGGWVVMVLTCLGIIADITPPGPERSFMFTLIEGGQVVMISGSIILTTYWIDNFDLFNPMLVSIVMAATVLLIVSFGIPETLQNVVPFTCSSQIITRSFKVYKNSENFPNRKWILRLLLVCIILGASVTFSKSNVQQLILRSDPHFKWSKTKISLYVSLSLIVCWVKVLIDTKILLKCFDLKDLTFAILGCTSSLASLIVFSFAKTDDMAYIAVAAGMFTLMMSPMIKSFASKHVLLREQGALFAGFSACEIGLSSMIGMFYEYIYRESSSVYRGLTSDIMASIMLIILIIVIVLKIRTRSEVRYGYIRSPDDVGPFERVNA